MEEFDIEERSGTHSITNAYLTCFGLFAVHRLIFPFCAPFQALNSIGTGSILLICLSIFGIVALFKYLVVLIHKACEIKKSTQMRNEILIGLSGIIICGVVPRILVFYVKFDDYFFFSSTFLSGAISTTLYFFFVYECDKKYESDWNADWKFYLKSLSLHTFVLFVTIVKVLNYNFDTYKTMNIILYQMIFWFICVSNTIDLYGVLSGIRKLKDVNGVGNAENDRLRIDCKICRMEYSYTQIPRILNGCGHTICEVCADTLLSPNQLHFLLCPFCKTRTAVNGPARMLHKNYGILEIINDLKD